MTQSRPFLVLATLICLSTCLAGCGGTPSTDQTGPGDKGLGPAGTNATDAPMTPEEQYKKEQEQDAAFKKAYRPK